MLQLIILVTALIAFLLDTIGVSARVNLTALGLALVTLSFLVAGR